mmetsp:Transcript_60811/g.106841  ORF Transcript_60811/g.106841 Transcript_60811/m.106841 type:complete len:202 (-) Transcript_60811:2349-2954(-)
MLSFTSNGVLPQRLPNSAVTITRGLTLAVGSATGGAELVAWLGSKRSAKAEEILFIADIGAGAGAGAGATGIAGGTATGVYTAAGTGAGAGAGRCASRRSISNSDDTGTAGTDSTCGASRSSCVCAAAAFCTAGSCAAVTLPRGPTVRLCTGFAARPAPAAPAPRPPNNAAACFSFSDSSLGAGGPWGWAGAALGATVWFP